jgi:hypothetical protein
MWDFAPGWRHQPGIKVPLLPGAISAESNLKNGAGSISQFSTSARRSPVSYSGVPAVFDHVAARADAIRACKG